MPPGSFGPCSLYLCEAGTFDHDNNAGTPCLPCTQGQYCPRGATNDDFLHGVLSCSRGTTDHDVDPATPCISCQAGFDLSTTGLFGVCLRHACPFGQPDHDFDTRTPCFQCGPGHYVPGGSAGPCEVFICEAGLIDNDDNPETPCVAPEEDTLDSKLLAIILGSTIGGLFLIMMAALCCIRRRHKRKQQRLKDDISALKVKVDKAFRDVIPSADFKSLDKEFEAKEISAHWLNLDEELGSGAFGQVFKATLHLPHEASKIVAVKALQEDCSMEDMGNFLLEARTMAALTHPNLIPLLHLSSTEPPFYLVFPLMQNGDLKNYLKKRAYGHGDSGPQPLTTTEAHSVALSIASAMEYLALKKFVHRYEDETITTHVPLEI